MAVKSRKAKPSKTAKSTKKTIISEAEDQEEWYQKDSSNWLEKDLDNNRLVRELFWTKTEFQLILFRGHYSCMHLEPEGENKTDWRLRIEEEEEKIKQLIVNAVERKIFAPSNSDKNGRIYVFKYDEPGYPPSDLLKLIPRAGYIAPTNLIESIEGERFEEAAELLQSLHEGIIYKLKYGENPPELKSASSSEADTKKGSQGTKNKGGPPLADDTGDIARKIEELKAELDEKGSKYNSIPWDIRFTKCVQRLKKDKILKSGKIKKEDLYKKVHPAIKGIKYTALVGISTDTVQKMIKKTHQINKPYSPTQRIT